MRASNQANDALISSNKLHINMFNIYLNFY